MRDAERRAGHRGGLPVRRTGGAGTRHAVQPGVILIDLCMPTMDGFSVITQLRAEPLTAKIPIILVSSEDAPQQKVRGFAAGANDYLVKWPARAELVARVRYHAEAHRARTERDEAYASLQTSQAQLLQRTRELELSQAALHRPETGSNRPAHRRRRPRLQQCAADHRRQPAAAQPVMPFA